MCATRRSEGGNPSGHGDYDLGGALILLKSDPKVLSHGNTEAYQGSLGALRVAYAREKVVVYKRARTRIPSQTPQTKRGPQALCVETRRIHIYEYI